MQAIMHMSDLHLHMAPMQPQDIHFIIISLHCLAQQHICGVRLQLVHIIMHLSIGHLQSVPIFLQQEQHILAIIALGMGQQHWAQGVLQEPHMDLVDPGMQMHMVIIFMHPAQHILAVPGAHMHLLAMQEQV